MSNLTIKERQLQDVTILDLAGNIRMGEDSIKIRSALREIAEEGNRKVLLNLAGVHHIDSSGLGELVAGYASLRRSGGELKLINLTERVSELMVITKLLTVFEVFENEEEAINSFRAVSEHGVTEQSDSVAG